MTILVPILGRQSKKILNEFQSAQGAWARRSDSAIAFAPNLKWPEFDITTPIEEATRMQVGMGNAANACFLAEV